MGKRVGIVLSGGAVRGFAHIGVLKALEEKGIYPDVVSGASAGAIIGAFYCAGYPANSLEKIAKKINFLAHIRPNVIPKKSFFRIVNLEETLRKYIEVKNIEELEKEFYVCITNLNKGRPEYWNRGDLTLLLKASSSLPVLFEPVSISDSLYIDGGVMNNLPVEPLIDRCDFIIGVDVNPFWEEKNLNNVISIAIRSFYLAVRSNIESRKKYCDIFIQPPELSKVGLFELWKMEEAIKIGYEYTKNQNIDI